MFRSLHHDHSCALVFVPALLAYLLLLYAHINTTPQIGHAMNFVAADQCALIVQGASVDVLATGFHGLQGITWINDEITASSYLLLSESTSGYIWRWEEGKGLITIGKSLYRFIPALHSSQEAMPAGIARVGSAAGVELLVCERGNKVVSRIYSNATKKILVDNFRGESFNGPTTAVLSGQSRELYFTDPAWGSGTSSSLFLLPLDSTSGAAAGEAVLVASSLSNPHGLAFSTDYKLLYATNADPGHPVVRAFVVSSDGLLYDAGNLFDAGKWFQSKGLDNLNIVLRGIKVDAAGRVYIACQDGVLILPPGGGSPLAYIDVGVAISDVSIADDGYLYMISYSQVFRVHINLECRP